MCVLKFPDDFDMHTKVKKTNVEHHGVPHHTRSDLLSTSKVKNISNSLANDLDLSLCCSCPTVQLSNMTWKEAEIALKITVSFAYDPVWQPVRIWTSAKINIAIRDWKLMRSLSCPWIGILHVYLFLWISKWAFRCFISWFYLSIYLVCRLAVCLFGVVCLVTLFSDPLHI